MSHRKSINIEKSEGTDSRSPGHDSNKSIKTDYLLPPRDSSSNHTHHTSSQGTESSFKPSLSTNSVGVCPSSSSTSSSYSDSSTSDYSDSSTSSYSSSRNSNSSEDSSDTESSKWAAKGKRSKKA